jgi:hypothetical protein
MCDDAAIDVILRPAEYSNLHAMKVTEGELELIIRNARFVGKPGAPHGLDVSSGPLPRISAAPPTTPVALP